MEIYCVNIDKMRRALGMTVPEVVDLAGLGSRQTWYNLKAKRKPDIDTAARLCVVFGCTLNDIIRWKR